MSSARWRWRIASCPRRRRPTYMCPAEARARRDSVESPSRSRFLIEHDLFGKPLRTFPDHALAYHAPFRVTGGARPGTSARDLFRRDLARRRGRVGKIGGELCIARFRVLDRLLLDRPVAADALGQ